MSEAVYPRFVESLERLTPLEPNEMVRVALSGGPDSVALVTLFLELRERRRPDLRLSVGHVHHGLRGQEADADAQWCQALARRHDLPWVCESVDVAGMADRENLSWETAAREARLRAFARWASEHDVSVVATGHTADDQVETILGNLFRGTGLRGLRGMPRERPLPGSTARLIRPLLGVERADLADLLRNQGLEARLDASNQDPRFRRNRIRNELLPLIEDRINPGVRRAVLGLGNEATLLHRWHSEQVEAVAARSQVGPDVIMISGSVLRELAPALHAPLLDSLWQRACARPTGLTRDHHDAWCRLLKRDGAGTRYDLPDGWRIERVGRWTYLWRPPSAPPPPSPVDLAGETSVLPWCDARVVVSSAPSAGGPDLDSRDRTVALLPGSWLGPETRIRAAHPRDRIRIEKGTTAVFELLRSLGVPRRLRRLYPVCECGEEVVWVPGVRTAPRTVDAPSVGGRIEFDGGSSTGFILGALVGHRGRVT